MSKAASAVALRKGLWRDKQGFWPEAYLWSTSRAKTSGERRAAEKEPFMDGNGLAFNDQGHTFTAAETQGSHPGFFILPDHFI